MKQYSHDYSKVSNAESHLLAAIELNSRGNVYKAWKQIEAARSLLQEYLANDNMVEDDDAAEGWVKASDAKRLEDAIDFLY